MTKQEKQELLERGLKHFTVEEIGTMWGLIAASKRFPDEESKANHVALMNQARAEKANS